MMEGGRGRFNSSHTSNIHLYSWKEFLCLHEGGKSNTGDIGAKNDIIGAGRILRGIFIWNGHDLCGDALFHA